MDETNQHLGHYSDGSIRVGDYSHYSHALHVRYVQLLTGKVKECSIYVYSLE